MFNRPTVSGDTVIRQRHPDQLINFHRVDEGQGLKLVMAVSELKMFDVIFLVPHIMLHLPQLWGHLVRIGLVGTMALSICRPLL